MNQKQARIITLLSSGSRYSVIDIAVRLHIGDPRSVIRNIRNMGINVNDEWVEAQDGGRYKRYWIENAHKNGE